MIFLRLSEGIFGFGSGGVNRIESTDNRYGDTVYQTVLYNNMCKLSAVKESLEEIQILLDNVREKKDT